MPKSKARNDSDDYDSDAPLSQSSESEDEGIEDYKKGGYHPVNIGETYHAGKYTVLRKLGWGHFSTVWLVINNVDGGYGAMKVQKSAKHYTEAACDEITLLTQIKEGDPSNSKHCVHLLDHFQHTGPNGRHVCMVFEVLGDNLLALIKMFDYRGVPIPIVRNLARQMLVGLDYLHRELQIIHTDFKPENVMLVRPLRQRVWELPGLPAHLLSQGPLAPPLGPPTGPSPLPPTHPASSAAPPPSINKNQRKKAKRRAKKEAARAGAGAGAGAGAAAAAGGAQGSGAAVGGGQPGLGGEAGGAAGAGAPLLSIPGLSFEELATVACKLVDFGNACWTHKQFTADIQTRQYRSPEVILGARYSTPCDMWSLACMLFELITGDLLFDPRSGDGWERDEDHLAQFMELLGRMPRKVYDKGKYAREYFNRHGELRHIKRLRFWPLEKVFAEKYSMPLDEAQGLADFLTPMLDFIPEKRATAAEMLNHPWLACDRGP
ncbi:kinase-like domain-containing protein, partial [Haematococcus lacustris]